MALMAYAKLSDQVAQLDNPQKADSFVKLFRTAAREGAFDAVQVEGRFTLPKEYKPRKEGGREQRDVKEMVFERTPAFDAWFEGVQQQLVGRARQPKVTVSLESIERGEVDFKALAEETRAKMTASFAKGQALGNSRAKPKAKPKRASKAK